MSQTIEQKIAEAEDRLARLRAKSRALENGQKIILGGLLINAARTQPQIRSWLLAEVEQAVTRHADLYRLSTFLAELRALPSDAAR